MKTFALSLAFLYLVAAPARAATGCVEGVQSSRNLQVQTISLSSGCAVMLTPVSARTSYRIYTISQRGVVQIFNDYDVADADISKSTGARSFFFFPRKAVPEASILPGGDVQVATASGVKLRFDPGKLADSSAPAVPPSILSHPGDPILATESPDVVPTNEGGVELMQTPGSGTLILDTGFLMGNASFTDPSRTSVFVDPRGNRCQVRNVEIFSYADAVDPQVAFAKDADLWAFLGKRCPGLSLPPL